MFKTYDLCNSCAYVNRIWACLIWLHVVIVESTKLPSDALPLLSWWPWGANPIVSRQDLVDDGGSWEHDDINWDDGNMLCFSCLKHHLCLGAFKYVLLFSSEFGDDPNWYIYIYIRGVKPPSRVLMSLDFFGVFYFKNNVWLFGGPTPLWFIRLYELGMT